jgi:YHS domain-containing protein
MERDPACGILIDPADALRLEYHGNTYYFCSHSCKNEFEDRPEEYAKHAPAPVFSKLVFEPIRLLASAIQEIK